MPYGTFAISQNGELTKKQEETVAKIRMICLSFYERGNLKPVQRTWTELKSRSKVSKAFLSMRLHELIKQGVIKKESKVDPSGKVMIFYTYTEEYYKIDGKRLERSILPGARIYYDKSKAGTEVVQWGYFKSGQKKNKNPLNLKESRKRVQYFVPET